MCIHRIIYTVYFFYINVCYTCVYLYANCIACFFKPKQCSILFHSDTRDRRFPLMNFERTSVQTSRTVWVDPKFLQHIQGNPRLISNLHLRNSATNPRDFFKQNLQSMPKILVEGKNLRGNFYPKQTIQGREVINAYCQWPRLRRGGSTMRFLRDDTFWNGTLFSNPFFVLGEGLKVI